MVRFCTVLRISGQAPAARGSEVENLPGVLTTNCVWLIVDIGFPVTYHTHRNVGVLAVYPELLAPTVLLVTKKTAYRLQHKVERTLYRSHI